MPNLRYQFRDRPHTTASVVKCTLRMAPSSETLRRLLITGQRSFARRARNSFRFQEIWVRKQKESLDDFLSILTNMSFAEQRYSSRSNPMVRFLVKLGPAIDVLVEMAQVACIVESVTQHKLRLESWNQLSAVQVSCTVETLEQKMQQKQ